MNQTEKKRAAADLKRAHESYYLALDGLIEIGDKYPALAFYLGRFIESIDGGDDMLGGIDEVTEYLRDGIDSDDKYAEHYLLGWNKWRRRKNKTYNQHFRK